MKINGINIINNFNTMNNFLGNIEIKYSMKIILIYLVKQFIVMINNNSKKMFKDL